MAAREIEGEVVRSSDLFKHLSGDERARLIATVHQVQGWINAYALALGKRRPPKAKIAETTTFYGPVANQLAITARALLHVEERHLRIIVAHEMGHFTRRWRLLFVRSEVGMLNEERIADRIALQLTGATFEDIAAAVKALAAVEGSGADMPMDEYLAFRRAVLEMPD